jgi:hypothetical protein
VHGKGQAAKLSFSDNQAIEAGQQLVRVKWVALHMLVANIVATIYMVIFLSFLCPYFSQTRTLPIVIFVYYLFDATIASISVITQAAG